MGTQQQLNAFNKICIVFLFCLLSFNAKAQFSFKYDSSISVLYLFEKNGDTVKCLDTMLFLSSYRYSFHLRERQILYSWFEYDLLYPNAQYALTSCLINDSGKFAKSSHTYIPLRKFPIFKEKKMKITLNQSGICLNFEKGSIPIVVLAYSNLEMNSSKFNKVLKRIARMLQE